MLRIQTILMRASHKENTGAIVSCQRTKLISSTESMIKGIINAVTAWMTVSSNGMAAWKNSCEDFNVSDLVGNLDDENLQKFLRRHGILDLEIWTFSSEDMNHGYTFDTVLVDTNKLED